MAFFEHTFQIGFRDTGKSNTLTNRAFLSFMEDIGGLHSDCAGYGINDIEKTHLTWILVGWKLKVFDRPKCGQKIRIVTWGKDFGRVHALRDFEVYDTNNKLIAIATSKWVLFNTQTSRLTRISQEVVDAYTIEDKSVFDEEITFSIDAPTSTEVSNTLYYTILRRDIDINNHMHNLYYLDFAYEVLPEEVYNNISFNNVEIVYKKECSLNSKIKCEYIFSDNAHYIYIKNEDDSSLHTIIKLY